MTNAAATPLQNGATASRRSSQTQTLIVLLVLTTLGAVGYSVWRRRENQFFNARTLVLEQTGGAMQTYGNALRISVEKLQNFEREFSNRSTDDLKPVVGYRSRLQKRENKLQKRQEVFDGLVHDADTLIRAGAYGEAYKKLVLAEIAGSPDIENAYPEILSTPRIEDKKSAACTEHVVEFVKKFEPALKQHGDELVHAITELEQLKHAYDNRTEIEPALKLLGKLVARRQALDERQRNLDTVLKAADELKSSSPFEAFKKLEVAERIAQADPDTSFPSLIATPSVIRVF